MKEINNTYYLHTNDGVTIYLHDEVLLFSTDGFSKHGSHIAFYFKYKYLLDSKGYVDTNKVSYMIKSLQLAIKENHQFLSDEERKTWDHYYYYKYNSPKSNLKKRKNANGVYHVNLKGVSKKPILNDNPVAKFEIDDVVHSKHWRTEVEIDLYPYFKHVIKSINDIHFCN